MKTGQTCEEWPVWGVADRLPLSGNRQELSPLGGLRLMLVANTFAHGQQIVAYKPMFQGGTNC